MSRAQKEVWLKRAFFMLGACAGLIILATKSPTAMEWLTKDSGQYGDLYRFAQVRAFKPAAPLPRWGGNDKPPPLPPAHSPLPVDTHFFFGDSFGYLDVGVKPFGLQVRDQVKSPVICVFNRDYSDMNVFRFLKRNPPPPGASPVVAYEIVERSIAKTFAQPIATNVPPILSSSLSLRQQAKRLVSNTEQNHQILMIHSFLTTPLTEFWNSTRFNLTGAMAKETPLYSLKPPMLFFDEEVESYFSRHTDSNITQMADVIARFARELRALHHCELVFIPVPNKITLCAKFSTDQPYDEFLPRLCRELHRRSVRTVDLLPCFRREQDCLYYATDTHWNPRGIQVALEETLKVWPARREKAE